ncbi:MAG: hypothetical protein JWR37_3361 [Mycobacterium sp.]|jgi:hypothetical protein|nr:hypothetical protein [Mycobacterium sp.]
MVRVHKGAVVQSKVHPPRAAGSLIDIRWFWGFLLLVIGIAAIVGIVVAAAYGQTTLAIIIGLVAGAFFSRVAC